MLKITWFYVCQLARLGLKGLHKGVCVWFYFLYIRIISCLFFRDIDKVDDLMQDITEQQELAQEISDAISKPVGFGEEFDEVSWLFNSR